MSHAEERQGVAELLAAAYLIEGPVAVRALLRQVESAEEVEPHDVLTKVARAMREGAAQLDHSMPITARGLERCSLRLLRLASPEDR